MKAPSRYLQPVTPGLFDTPHRLRQLQQMGDPLAALNAVVDWTIFVPVLARIPRAEPKAPGGRPAYPPLTMFKILVLQSLYGLSDEQAQFQILDRRSFQHFLGLTEADPVPDQNTIREFREKLTRAELFSELFAASNAGKCPLAGRRMRNDWPTKTWTPGGRRRTSRPTTATRIISWRIWRANSSCAPR